MDLRAFSSEMNCFLKSEIHEHSTKSQISLQIVHGIVRLFSMDLHDHGEDGFYVGRYVRRSVEIVVLCRFRILLTFTVNRRTGSLCKRLLPSFIFLVIKFFFVVPSSSFSIVWVFWIFFFLMRRVSPLSFHQPAKICILESHLTRRPCVEWAWFQRSSCYRVSPKLSTSPTSRYNRTRCGGGTCRNKRRYIHHCRSRLGHNFFFILILTPLRHCEATYQDDILGTTTGSEMIDIYHMKKINPLITCDIPFSQHVCELMFGVNATDSNSWIQINSSNNKSVQLCGIANHVSLWDFDLWSSFRLPSHFSQRHTTWHWSKNFVLDGMLSTFVGMTLMCFIWMSLCMLFGWVCACLTWQLSTDFLVALSWVLLCCSDGMKYFNHQMSGS